MNPIQLILNQKFLALKAKNPRLSHRYFAQQLGVSSGALSEILKGKRKVSAKLAAKLADRLHLDPRNRIAFLGNSNSLDEAQDLDYLQLSDDQFQLISEWHHYAILNLVQSEQCQHNIGWFSEQLNFPQRNIQDAVDRLLRLGMLTFEKKKYIRSKPPFKTSDDVLNLSIQKSNMEDLDLIREHSSCLDVHERDLTSITMLIDPLKMADFKKWIRKTQDQFALKFETTKSITPFRLTIALYPLRKSKR